MRLAEEAEDTGGEGAGGSGDEPFAGGRVLSIEQMMQAAELADTDGDAE